MFLLMIPLLVLYFLALGIAALRDRWKNRRNAKLLAEYGMEEAGQ
jgi:Sec-independent protein secretion pathway component TatC